MKINNTVYKNKMQNIFLFNSPIDLKREFNFSIKEPFIEKEIFIFFLLKNNDVLDLKINFEIAASLSYVKIYIRGILSDNADLKIESSATIGKQSFNANAFLQTKIITKNGSPSSTIKPFMNVKNNTAQAMHGTSVGKIDDYDLFYLESKGLPEESAKKIIMQGFFGPLINKITSLKDKESVGKLLENY